MSILYLNCNELFKTDNFIFKHQIPNDIFAFFLRFLYSHGYADCLLLIEECLNKWLKDLTENENVGYSIVFSVNGL